MSRYEEYLREQDILCPARVLSEAGSDADDLNFELLSHISPIGWDNVLLYGEIKIDPSKLKMRGS